ncbi:hypothetical protein, partial [Streptomyces sp. NPDC060022]|uniref:hypothetical protein n=1 Tax=Streptomyces sp. NPDC060022 TaxID=3347039 RepID=UPI00369D4F77
MPRFDAMEGTERWTDLTRGYESALGRALAADPKVTGTAHDAISLFFNDLVNRNGKPEAQRRFLPQGNRSAAETDAAMGRLLDAGSGAMLDELVKAFTQALGPIGPGRSKRASMTQLLTHYSGLVAGATRDESHTALRDFRKVLLGWLLPTNRVSLSAIVGASRAAGLRDTRETAALVGEAADLYVWAAAEFMPGDTAAGVPLPHHAGYLDHAGWFTSEVSGDGAVPGGVWSALETGARSLGAGGAVAGVPQGNNPGVPRKSWVARQEALRAWLGRHGRSPLKGLHPSHVLALYLLGGADRVLLDARFVDFEPSREIRELLGREMRSAVIGALEDESLSFPFLLLRDNQFNGLAVELADLEQELGSAEELARTREGLLARAEDLVARVLGEVPAHRAMVMEALGQLPSVGESVWLRLPGLGDLTPEGLGGRPGDLDSVSVPALRVGSLDEEVTQAGVVGGDLLVEVVSSSAVDVSVFSPDPGRREVAYGRDTVLRVVHREVVQDPVAGAYEFVRVEEPGPEEAGPTTSPPVDASEMPGHGVWNSGPATTKQKREEREEEEQRSAHWNTGPAQKKQKHEGEATAAAPAVVRPRFPGFYSNDGWAGDSRRFEEALGRFLNINELTDPLQAAVRGLFDVLAKTHDEADARSAFLDPGTEDSAAAWERLMGPGASRSEVMEAFANAAYANVSSPYTLSRLWDDHPELNTGLLSLRPSDAVPYDESDPVFLDRRDRRGLLMTSGPATEAEWLLKVYQSLKLPAHTDEPLQFRDGLLARALTTGTQSLFEILEAADRAGVPDDTLPDLAEIDAARLYAWADALRQADTEDGGIGPSEDADLVPPYRRVYARSIRGLTAEVTGTPGVFEAIRRITRIFVTADLYPIFAEEFEVDSADTDARKAVVHDWLLRHGNEDLLWNVRVEHVPALYVVSGADGALLRAVSGDGVVDA